MSTYQLLKIIIRGFGLFAFWKAASALAAFIGVVGIFSNIPNASDANSFLNAALFSNFLLFLVPATFCFLAIFNTKGIIRFLGISPDDSSTVVTSEVTIYLVVISIGTILLVTGCSSALSFDYNVGFNNNSSLVNLDELKTGAAPIMQKTQSTQSRSYKTNFNFFALLELILGIVFLARAKKITTYIVNKYGPTPVNPEEF